jgi:DNA end-binding protein Ku
LQKKAEGAELPEPQQEEGGEVVDLMEALRQSVAATKRYRSSGSAGRSKSKAASKRKRTSARRKTSARKAS